MVVVTPSPSSGEPGKLSPQQPSRSKPASVGSKPTTMEQLTPKPPTNSYPVDPNLCYPVNKFNSTRFLLENASATEIPSSGWLLPLGGKRRQIADSVH